MGRQLGLFFLFFVLAFVVGGVAMALDQPVVGAIGFIGLILVAVGMTVWGSARVRSGNEQLVGMRGVRHGRATILSATPTAMMASMGEARYPPRVYRLRLSVEVEGRQPYEITHSEAAHPWNAGHLQAGRVVPCLVHPTKDKMVHLQFESSATPTAGTTPWTGAPAPGTPTGFGWTDGSGVGGVPATGGAMGAGAMGAGANPEVDIDGLVRRVTGSGLDELLRRVEAGEQVPGVEVTGPGEVRIVETHVQEFPAGAAPVGSVPVDDERWSAQTWTTATPPDPPPASSPFGHADAHAVVNGARDLGPSSSGHRSVELDLLVAVPGQTPYRVVQVVERPTGRTPTIGTTVRVRVDPTRPSEITLLD